MGLSRFCQNGFENRFWRFGHSEHFTPLAEYPSGKVF
jgi:hypothetical protein